MPTRKISKDGKRRKSHPSIKTAANSAINILGALVTEDGLNSLDLATIIRLDILFHDPAIKERLAKFILIRQKQSSKARRMGALP